MELLIIDTTQIQRYIFGSNRLRENVVASYLVNASTQDWAIQQLPKRHNVEREQKRVGSRFKFSNERIEDGQLDAEVLYMGGGNAAILFRDAKTCDTFVRKHSRFVLQHAPNLQLILYRQPFNFEEDNLYDVISDIFDEALDAHKRERVRSTPLLGLGVTADCQSTGLPATQLSETLTKDEEPYPVSAEIAAKTKKANLTAANQRLKTYLQFDNPEYEFPSDLDYIGRTEGEHSYVAIVHADGDGIGSRLKEIGAKYGTKDGETKTLNRAYITARRDFSIKLEQSAREAMEETLHYLTNKIDEGERPFNIKHRNKFGDVLPPLELREVKGDARAYYLPFRPIVFGGDDVTFICDGRLGLTLTNFYLERFKEKTGVHLKAHIGAVTASAGVAIVKSHYPFARAYGLSAALGDSAKAYRKKLVDDEGYAGGCIDWHFAMSGLIGDMQTIRDQQYKTLQGMLTLRPVTIEDNPAIPYRSWEFVSDGVAIFQDVDNKSDKPNWSTRRNKVKALRDVLREGSTATRQFIKSYQIGRLPSFNHTNFFEESGWNDDELTDKKVCGYFDAIELSDWHMEGTNDA